MELGSHIKARRAELGISQDELAGRIYVSRQTISSWENDKTYPDVQSLLLLSQVFGTTIDELVRGDVDTMKETVEKDARLVKRLSYVMVGFIVLMVLALVWWVCQMTVWDLSILQTSPSLALVIVLWGIDLFAARWADRIKREQDFRIAAVSSRFFLIDSRHAECLRHQFFSRQSYACKPLRISRQIKPDCISDRQP